MKMKKLATLLCATGFAFGLNSMNPAAMVNAAEKYDQATVVTINNLDEYDAKAPLSWSCNLVSTENGQKVSDYATFTLNEDSIVKMSVKYTKTVDLGSISPDVFVYSNQGMTSKKLEFGRYDSGETKDVYLPAGTYYIEATDEKLTGWQHGAKVDVSICALPAKKALSASVKLNAKKTQATVTVTQALGADLKNIQYVYGAYDPKDNDNHDIWKTPIFGDNYYNHIATELTSGNSFTVKKNGTYTIRVITNNKTTYSIQYTVKGIDTKAPVISGVKNKKTYKKTKTICFYDKESGIKTAKLNGKKVTTKQKVSKKRGYTLKISKQGKYTLKVFKNGSYTLKVTDKAGKTKTVKFKIKK